MDKMAYFACELLTSLLSSSRQAAEAKKKLAELRQMIDILKNSVRWFRHHLVVLQVHVYLYIMVLCLIVIVNFNQSGELLVPTDDPTQSSSEPLQWRLSLDPNTSRREQRDAAMDGEQQKEVNMSMDTTLEEDRGLPKLAVINHAQISSLLG